MRSVLPEVDQPSVSRAEPAGVEIEGSEVRFEVDVQPLASRLLDVSRRLPDQFGPNAAALMACTGLGVEEKGMIAAVPSDVDESHHRAVAGTGHHPAETLVSYPVPPTRLRDAAVGPHEFDHLGVAEVTSPLVGDPGSHHPNLDTPRF
jgi:hypothetical protein